MSLAAALAVLGALGAAGGWSMLPAGLLLAGLVWLPGAVILGTAAAFWPASELLRPGPGRVAAESTLGLVLLLPAVGPLFLVAGDIAMAATSLGLVHLIAGLAALAVLSIPRDGGPPLDTAETGPSAWRTDGWAVAVAAVLLLPLVLSHAGGTVDDWWDMAFVSAWSAGPELGMGEPFLGSGRVHPRFMWNAWLLVQALVVGASGLSPHSLQVGQLAALVCLLSISAQAGLAGVLFGKDRPVARLATILALPCWLLATEAIPFFTRLHQDKFVAVLVFVPVMLAAALAYTRRRQPMDLMVLLVASLAACSVHSLVYAVGLAGVVVTVAAANGGKGWRSAAGTLLAAAAPLAYPLTQAWMLAPRLEAQGISLASPDNPVVGAHLWLGRLAGSGGPLFVVDPRSVFGPFVLLAIAGLLVAASRSYRTQVASRVLLALTLVPLAMVCVPGLAAVTGKLMLPWMIYRLLWLVPVAALAGLAFEWAFDRSSAGRRVLAVSVLTLLTVLTVVPVALARAERGMHARASERPRHPRGTTLAVLDFLAASPERGPVLAPLGLSEVIPALARRPVVAFSERGTLVFSSRESEAYQRMYDRARFFSSRADASERTRVARRYGAHQAVFRGGWVTQGSEVMLMSRFAMQGTLLSAAAQPVLEPELGVLPKGARTVFRNSDFLVVEWPALPHLDPAGIVSQTAGEQWTAGLQEPLEQIPELPSPGLELLASSAGWPGAEVYFDPVPLSLGSSTKPIWMRGLAHWDDGPSEVIIRLELGRHCRPRLLELVPFMRKSRRQVLELEVAGQRAVFRARDGQPLRLALDGRLRGSVELGVRSLLGTPIGLGELRVLGNPGDCQAGGPVGEARDAGARLSLDFLLGATAAYPNNARTAIALADRLADGERVADAEAVVRLALARDRGLANGWVELGLLGDLRGRHRAALLAYRRAVRLDSNNAWAHGCLAWARLRAGQPVAALYHVYRARRLDPRYADAHTILSRIARGFGLNGRARVSLRRAIELDRRRNWAYMELASLLAEDGQLVAALRVLDDFLLIEPEDESVLDLRESLVVARAELPSG